MLRKKNKDAKASSDGTSPSLPSETARREHSDSMWSLALAALFFLAIAFICGYTNALAHYVDKNVRDFLKDVALATATALGVSWGFTRLLEVPHVTRVIVTMLRDLVFGEQYLRSVGNQSLEDFRRRIDKVLYGDEAVGYRWSLYNFLEHRIHPLYGAPYRRRFNTRVECRVRDDDWFHWKQVTTYIYVHNGSSGDGVVRFSRTAPVHESMKDKAAANASAEVFNTLIESVSVSMGEVTYSSDTGDRTKLVGRWKTKPSASLATIQAEIVIDAETISYSFACPIPSELLLGDTFVSITENRLVARTNGDVFFSIMNAPTDGMMLDCYFPEFVRIEPAQFSLDASRLNALSPLKAGHAHASIEVPGWLIPGHGACFAWIVENGSGSSVNRAHQSQSA
jgi:hypothetical protein